MTKIIYNPPGYGMIYNIPACRTYRIFICITLLELLHGSPLKTTVKINKQRIYRELLNDMATEQIGFLPNAISTFLSVLEKFRESKLVINVIVHQYMEI